MRNLTTCALLMLGTAAAAADFHCPSGDTSEESGCPPWISCLPTINFSSSFVGPDREVHARCGIRNRHIRRVVFGSVHL